jgi:gamma-glutamyltranspeptidase/glutathione hydrolase
MVKLRFMAAVGLILALSGCASLKPVQVVNGPAMVAAADPRAVDAGLEMLRAGGSATDAAIAAMMVLGLVEPQSAGIGGGGFLLHYDRANRDVDAFDGRETAPAKAGPDLFLGADGKPLPYRDAVVSGLSTGAPSLIAMLELAHREHGKLPWARLFDPAIKLADEGFAVSPRLNQMITGAARFGALQAHPTTKAYFFTAEGQPLPVGFIRINGAYGATLRAIQEQGADALRAGPIAEAIVAAVAQAPRPGTLSLDDLKAVKARSLEPVCGAYRTYRVCGMGPPSSGGVAVLSILGLFERARPAPEGPASAEDWSAFLWASRIAYADRDHYVGDDTFVPVPTKGLFDPRYLTARAGDIKTAAAPVGALAPGDPSLSVGGTSLLERWGQDKTAEAAGTTHLSVVDGEGDAVALTATVESVFGSQRMAAGFFLNNQLTDFSLAPTKNGLPVANAPAPRKRPRSSMAPTIITEPDGDLYAVIGSPGGSAIISYVAKTIVGLVDWDLPMQEAINLPNLTARSPQVRAETARMAPGLSEALTARGWLLQPSTQEASGLHGVRITAGGLDGGADPRREGVARQP